MWILYQNLSKKTHIFLFLGVLSFETLLSQTSSLPQTTKKRKRRKRTERRTTVRPEEWREAGIRQERTLASRNSTRILQRCNHSHCPFSSLLLYPLLSGCLFSPLLHPIGDLSSLVTMNNHSHCPFSPLLSSYTRILLLSSYTRFSLLLYPRLFYSLIPASLLFYYTRFSALLVYPLICSSCIPASTLFS